MSGRHIKRCMKSDFPLETKREKENDEEHVFAEAQTRLKYKKENFFVHNSVAKIIKALYVFASGYVR